ncbi:hypothetical protein B0H13DRAFT_1913969 [Mycena leptocephala]|nr:hypothetical protein B0H13DRAFT_1913969 [Mycena leptocephala]
MSRRRRGGAPGSGLYIHQPDQASVVRVSNDGRRAFEQPVAVDRALAAGTPAYFQEDLATNAALDAEDFGYGMGDTSLPPEEQGTDADGISVRVKAKRYQNSDLPFQTWVGHRDEYLDELLRLEGRGDVDIYSKCGSCNAANPEYRCEHQSCYGPGMFCCACIVARHEVLPTHWIQQWNGSFLRVSVSTHSAWSFNWDIPGFVVYGNASRQLLRVCWWPATARDPSTCATFNVVRLFDKMNCLGKISGFHFLRSLELLTNADGLSPLPPGKNLPEGWDKINWAEMPEDLSYKYFLSLAADCNFRLINRDVSSEARDPIIDDGLGYFCNRVEYKKYLRNHVNDEEISSCSGFQAMFLANAKRVKGLRTTGVGGVTCARHNMWRPNGIGDLQRGERSQYNNVIPDSILRHRVSVQQNFWSRMAGLPEWMRLDPKKIAVWFKVPNFHILGHKWPCHSPEHRWGRRRTKLGLHEWRGGLDEDDGAGRRHAFLEGLFGFHNWMRTVSYRNVFSRRMARNLKEGRQHREAFEAFTELLEGEKPELVQKWRGWVRDWESEQHSDGIGSPFESVKPVHTMKEIKLRLGKGELTRTGANVEIERPHTSSAFITLGLEIEQSQRILTIDLKALSDPSPLQTLDFVKRKTALLKRINRFRKLQRTYMPDLIWDDKTRGAEEMKLFMPSELSASSRENVCEKGLDKLEEEMCEGELAETLEDLRDALRTRTMTNRFKHRNATGVLRQISIRVHKAKLRYRYARNALLRLRGHGGWEKLYRALEESDVRGVNERAVGEEGGREGATEAVRRDSGGDADLVDALRVEWCKAYARMRRWHEDIVVVDEEMRRTIDFGAYMEGEWEARATARTARMTPALAEGLPHKPMGGSAREGESVFGGVPEDPDPNGRVREVVIELDEEVDPEDEEGDVAGDELVDDDGGVDGDELDPDDVDAD